MSRLGRINDEILSVYNTYNTPELHDKILEFLQKDLPDKMESYLEKKRRFENLELSSSAYINDFLVNSEMNYMYIPNSEIFISYNGENFKLINESDILYEILSGISSHKELMPWKYKIKNLIMKAIKEKTLFDIIPESYTIQFVLNHVTPLLLDTKEEAKYFLTLLGDAILKKNQTYIHLLELHTKDFITNLEENVFHFFKSTYHINPTIKYNWHEHEYDKCRILHFTKSTASSSCWYSFIKYHILDIIAVAVHYSKRYGNSEEYILSKLEGNPKLERVLFLKDKTKESLVDKFIKEKIISVNDKTLTVGWNEIFYIWKIFLYDHELPNVIFKNNLRQILCEKLENNTSEFIGITSPHLNFITNLKEFWSTNINKCETDEFEISEICDIYNEWLETNSGNKKERINEKNMETLLDHFYSIKTKDSKIITSICCLLWNKQQEMKTIIEDIKLSFNFYPEMYEKSIQGLYMDYCSKAKAKFNYRTVSKKYFEKYINQVIPDKYIKKKRILNDYWIN